VKELRQLKVLTVSIVLFLVLVAVTPVYAIPYSTVLKRIEDRWGQLERFQVDLRQSVRDLIREQERYYVGVLFVLRGDRLRLDYQLMKSDSPRAATAVSAWVASASFSPEDIYLADRDFLIHFDRAAKVAIKQYVAEAALPPIVQALAGTQDFRAEEFEEDYYIKPVEEEQINEQNTYLLKFTPKGQEKETLVSYDLWVDQESYLPVRLRVRSRDEAVEIDFYSPRTEEPLPENIFDVRLPPDSQLIDQTQEL